MSKTFMKKIIGIIPAREESVGLLKKNIKELKTKPLIAYTIEAGLASKYLDRLVISTDSLAIAKIAEGYGLKVPFLRPKELARDDVPVIAALQHALNYLEKNEEIELEVVVILQPTTPLRQSWHIDAAIEKLFNTNADSVVTVCEVEHHPLFVMKRLVDDRVFPFFPTEKRYFRRQDLPPVYRLNGGVYVTKRDIIMNQNTVLGEDTRAIIMDQIYSVDIDTEIDFKTAEAMLGFLQESGEIKNLTLKSESQDYLQVSTHKIGEKMNF